MASIRPPIRPLYQAWLDRLHPEDRERIDREARALLERDEPFEIEFRVILPDGSVRWTHGRGTMERDARGHPVRMVGVNIDVTQRKQFEEHQKLLVAELNHRVKNTLATVQAIAVQTVKQEGDADAFRSSSVARIQALAHAHGLLSRSEWQGADLAEVLRDELLPHAGAAESRVRLDGRPVRLGPRMALTLGMAFHELATNAANYGALATGDGQVAVRWKVVGSRKMRRLSIEWTEGGGPPVSPSTRRGCGSTLVERSIEHDLDGIVRRTFAPDGLRCTIAVPLPDDTAHRVGPGSSTVFSI